ncbi:MAG: acyltransferase family protein [Acidimicrobiia bacterium]|jgi:peptidoglycan/LPS O-acetylase OafA/YrhL
MSGGVVAPERDAVPPSSASAPPADAPERPRSFGYIPALDGVRGLAVAAVLIFHGGHLGGGFLSVDLFFVLSGFLITSLLLVEVSKTHRVDLAQFWLRRAKRLLPALFAMIIGVAAFAWLFAAPTELSRIRGDAISTLFYYANWHAIFSGRGYWDLFTSPSPLEHAWSLAIEEQFYLVWPLVVGALSWFVSWRARAGQKAAQLAPTLFGVCLFGAFVSPLLMAVLFDPGTDPSKIYVRTDTRMGTILMGAAFACWIFWKGPIKSRAARITLEVAALVGLVGMFAAWSGVNGQMTAVYRGGFLLFDIACVTLVAACSHPRPGVVAKMFSWRPIMALGLISYGLYLWHWPVYVTLTPSRTGLDGWALLALRVAVSLAFGIGSYFLVERPIRHRKLNGRQVLIAAPIAAAICVAAVLVSTAGAQVLPDAGSQFIATDGSAPKQDVRAAARDAVTSGAQRVLILGDSVGVNVGKAAVAQADGTDSAVVAGAIPGCVLTTGTGGYEATTRDRTFVVPDLHECTGGWFDTARQFGAETVILVYGTGASFLDVQLDGKFVDACTSAYQTWYEKQLEDAVAELQVDGATSVQLLRLPYPTADFMPDSAHASIDCVNAVHAKVATKVPGVAVLDLAGFVCPDGKCRTELDGVPLRSDGLHFDEGPPADSVAQWLLEQVRPPGG